MQKTIITKALFLGLPIFIVCLIYVSVSSGKRTIVSIKGEKFFINNEITYKGRYWQDNKIEGLLFNSRMVQGIFDDLNPLTREKFKYPDTGIWDPERNTNDFIEVMPDWKAKGLLAFTINLQGGSPLGYGNNGWINSTFDSIGNLRNDYINRLEKILNKADELGMVVILGYFYFGQDEQLKDEQAVISAVDNITNWILHKGYKNILIEINNECDILYDHSILKPERVTELIKKVHEISDHKLLVSTSFSGDKVPSQNVIESANFILLHGNSIENPVGIGELVGKVRSSKAYTLKPILFNEDDHYNFDKANYNLLSAIRAYTSWGFFDYRHDGEGFESGFQSVPVDWKISSDRKKGFFNKLYEITRKNLNDNLIISQ
jgi:hypothetical protein